MSSTQDASMDAGQMVSSEAKAAAAADNFDMELEDPYADGEYKPESPLTNYNEDDPVPALKKSTNGKEALTSVDKEIKKLALREKLAQNGFALRTMLITQRMKKICQNLGTSS